jgi:hypothetical protein
MNFDSKLGEGMFSEITYHVAVKQLIVYVSVCIHVPN